MARAGNPTDAEGELMVQQQLQHATQQTGRTGVNAQLCVHAMTASFCQYCDRIMTSRCILTLGTVTRVLQHVHACQIMHSWLLDQTTLYAYLCNLYALHLPGSS